MKLERGLRCLDSSKDSSHRDLNGHRRLCLSHAASKVPQAFHNHHQRQLTPQTYRSARRTNSLYSWPESNLDSAVPPFQNALCRYRIISNLTQTRSENPRYENPHQRCHRQKHLSGALILLAQQHAWRTKRFRKAQK